MMTDGLWGLGFNEAQSSLSTSWESSTKLHDTERKLFAPDSSLLLSSLQKSVHKPIKGECTE